MKRCGMGIWGPNFSTRKIEKALGTYKFELHPLSDPATAAELLANGKILGWFQGRMEFGPRALGAARSWRIHAIRK